MGDLRKRMRKAFVIPYWLVVLALFLNWVFDLYQHFLD